GDAARPVFLTFDGEITPGEPFAHMIENRDLVTALVAKARDEGVILRPTAVTACETQRDQAATSLADGATVASRLVVGEGRGLSWRRTGGGRGCASWPASKPLAGPMTRPPSSPRWRTSATITAAPRSISCLLGRSPSCR